jgi:energy-coupling factor transporter ATP-binding protein EcfA2
LSNLIRRQREIAPTAESGGKLGGTRHRQRAVSHRWIDVLWGGTVSGLVVVLASPLLVAWVGDYSAQSGLLGAVAASLLIAAIISRPSERDYWRRIRGRLGGRAAYFYPPHWFGVPIGMIALSVFALLGHSAVARLLELHALSGCARLEVVLWTDATLTLLFGGMAIIAAESSRSFRKHTTRSRPDCVADRRKTESNGLEEFVAWVKSDEEIGSEDEDRFNHRRIAERIERIIRDFDWTRRDEASLALLGDVGSGKTSILRLVSQRLTHKQGEHPHVETIIFGLWPYATEQAAAEALLEKIIDAISRHADVLGLRGIPRRYASIIRAGDGLFHAIGEALSESAQPEELLERMEPVLEAVDLTVVVMVEDVGRFADQNQRNIQSLKGLLHLLDRRRGIIVVAAVERLSGAYDVHKLARHVELVPSVSPRDVVAQLWLLGRWCNTQASGKVLLPSDKSSAVIPPEDSSFAELLFSDTSRTGPQWHSALSRLLSNPRRMKSTMRHVMAVWTELAGEIDLDHLIILSAIRSASTPVFDVVVAHLLEARSAEDASYRRGARLAAQALTQQGAPPDQARTPAQDLAWELQEVLRAHAEPSLQLEDLTALVGVLTPHLGQNSYIPRRALQGLQNPYYLQRFLSPGPLDGPDQDQPVIQAILAWNDRASRELEAMVDGGVRGDKIHHFASLLDPRRYRALLSRTVRTLSYQSADGWDRGIPDELVQLRRVAQRLDSDALGLSTFLERVLPILARIHLPLGHAVLHYFVDQVDRIPSLVSPEEATMIREAFRRALGSAFAQGQAKSLERAIRRGKPQTCLWACWGLDRLRAELQGTPLPPKPFDGWESFATVLLELAEDNPAVGVPQLLPFVVRDSPSHEPGEKEWDETSAANLFSDLSRMKALLRRVSVNPAWNEDTRARLQVARLALEPPTP